MSISLQRSKANEKNIKGNYIKFSFAKEYNKEKEIRDLFLFKHRKQLWNFSCILYVPIYFNPYQV